MTTFPVFVYGTLKKNQPNDYMIERPENGVAKFFGRGHTVKQYPLVIASMYNIPFMLNKEGTGKEVQGEIYEVDHTMLSTLDRFEETSYFNALYVRELQHVILTEDNKKQPQSKEIQCWTYFLEHYRPELLKLPYMENYDSLGNHGLPYKEEGDVDVRSSVILQ